MIGEYDCSFCDTNLRCILDAYTQITNLSGTWNLYAIPESSTIELFTDLTITDRFVVSDAQKYASDAQSLRFFDKQPPANFSIIYSSIYNTIYQPSYFSMTYHSPLMTTLYANYFVTATIPTINILSNQNRVLLSLFGGQTLMDQYVIEFTADYDSSCSIVDIKYDTDLYVVVHADIDGSGMGYYIIEIPGFPFSMPPTPYNVYAYRTSYQDAVHSLTPINNIPSHTGAIGEQSGKVILYRHELNTVSSNNCDERKALRFDHIPSLLDNFESKLEDVNYLWNHIPYISIGYSTTMKIQCEDEY